MYKPLYAKSSATKKKPVLLIVLLSFVLFLVVLMAVRGEKESISPNTITGTEHLPWEAGGKQPIEYTWEEYLALDDSAKDPFFESFASADEFDAWKASSSNDIIKGDVSQEFPWESSGKSPHEYTWEEYLSLDDAMKDAFFESFTSTEEFDEWMVNSGIGTMQSDDTQDTLVQFEEKLPSEYSWQEYEALTPEEKDLFFESFESPEAFEIWLNAETSQFPQSEVTPTELPNDSNSLRADNKPLNEYTWDEFEKLTPEQQEAFFLSFASADAFEEWMLQAKSQ